MSSDEEASQEESILLSRAACCSVRSKDSSSPKHFHTGNRKNLRSALHHKHLHGCHARGSSKNHWSMPQVPNPYSMGSKKRQNGDKNEQIAKSKRTCLGGRLVHSDWTCNSRKRNAIMNNLESSHLDEEGTFDYNHEYPSRRPRRVLSFNDHDSSPSEMTDQRSENSIPTSSTDGPSSSLCSSSSTTDSNASNLARFGQKPVFTDILSRPSTSKFGQPPCDEHENNNQECSLSNKAANYLESDEDSRSSVNSTSLKGGCQSTEGIRPVRKVVGRGCRKILESDDSSDNDWLCQYRKPPRCVSTDSDDSSDFPVKPRRKQFTKLSLSRLSSSDSNDDYVSQSTSHLPHNSRNSGTPKRPCNTSHTRIALNNSFENNFLGEHSYASLDVSRNRAIASTSRNSRSHSNNNNNHGTPSSPLFGQHRYSRHKGSSRRSVSPHPRMLSSSRRHSGLSSSSSSSLFKPQDSHRHCHLASEFPDLFDAEEDSSEVEFFTARSYSDTETSESINGVDMSRFSAGHLPHRNSSTIVLSSDEDEISIIFSSDSPHTSVRDRGHHRGSLGQRRRIRGSGCNPLSNTQTVPSASPDPVEQVRQVEEDERYARMLQAEFDAEANGATPFLNVTESDTDVDIPPHPLVSMPFAAPADSSYSSGQAQRDWFADREPSAPILASVSALNEPHLFVPMTPHQHHSRRVRGSRIGVPSNTSDASRRRRGPRTFQWQHGGDPWMWQFARVLGLGPAYSHDPDENDYEVLMNLAESVGEVLPRGLHKTEINRLPTRKFHSPGSGASSSQACDEIVHKRMELNKECQVCLCDYENGDLLRILPCFHEFHTPCIDPWLKINHTCPVCRVEVTFDD